MDEFNDYFCFCIDSLVSESTESTIVVTGDFNPNSNNFRVKRFELQCGLKQTVQVPTRGDNTLDLIFTNISKYYNVPTTQAPLGTSDHLIILWKSKVIEKSKYVTRKVLVRPIKESGLEAFGQWLSTHQWTAVETA
jgi:hypothetical protein